MEVDLILKKRDYKQNLVRSSDSNGGKVIFILLTKLIIFLMRLTIIDIRGSSFELVFR